MKLFADITGKLVNGMPLWLRTLLVLFIIVGILVLSFKISIYKDNQYTALQQEQIGLIYNNIGTKLDKLIEIGEFNNLDNLSKRGGEITIDQTFDLSKEIIYRKAVDEIEKNHIDKAYRQEMIRDNMYNLIHTLYKNDYSRLNQFSYNKKAFGYVIEDIDANEVFIDLIDRMFNKKYDSTQMKEEDLWNGLTANFEKFKIIARNKMGT